MDLINTLEDKHYNLNEDILLEHIEINKGMNISINNIYKKDRYKDSETLLMAICKNNFVNINLLKIMIDNGADINIKNNRNNTALIYLCKNKFFNREMLEYMINNNVDINVQNTDGDTALHKLCNNENVTTELIEIMIKSGANVNIQDNDGYTALMNLFTWSPKKNIGDFLELFINNSDIDLDLKNKYNINVLMNMCKYECINIQSLKIILDKIVDINAQNIYGETALLYLCKNDNINIELFDLMIKKGADINIKNNDDETFLMILCKVNYSYRMKNLQNVFATIIHVLNSYININMDINIDINTNTNTNIDTNFFINYRDKLGYTALLHLCSYENIINKEILELMIAKNADINVKNKYNDNILHKLCNIYNNNNINKELLEIVINKGVDINARDYFGNTPLMYLCTNNINKEILEFFIKSGADINSINNIYESALINICKNNRIETDYILLELLEFMINNGANINLKNYYTNNILFLIYSDKFLNENRKLFIVNCLKKYIDTNLEIKKIKNRKDDECIASGGFYYNMDNIRDKLIKELES